MDFNLKRKRYWQIISKVHDMNFNEQKGKEEKQITDLYPSFYHFRCLSVKEEIHIEEIFHIHKQSRRIFLCISHEPFLYISDIYLFNCKMNCYYMVTVQFHRPFPLILLIAVTLFSSLHKHLSPSAPGYSNQQYTWKLPFYCTASRFSNHSFTMIIKSGASNGG